MKKRRSRKKLDHNPLWLHRVVARMHYPPSTLVGFNIPLRRRYDLLPATKLPGRHSIAPLGDR